MKRYIITSAQACAKPLKTFWEGLQNYAKFNDAEIIVLPMHGISAKEDYDRVRHEFDDYIVEGKFRFNSNLCIEQFHVQPQNIDPATSQKRFAQRTTSLIFASPKQRLVPVTHSNKKFPKFLITTGAVTVPNYATEKHHNAERRRRGSIAKRDHEYGAIIVEIENDKEFRMRNIVADTTGKFVDLGTLYDGYRCREAKLEAMVLGDWHSGQTEPTIKKITLDMVKELKPKRLILHDFFDGHSVSHHTERKPVREKLLHQYDKGYHVLSRELKGCLNDLKQLSRRVKDGKIYIIWSNHHDFLPRYLEEVRFRLDMTNYRAAIKILNHIAAKDYNDGVKFGIGLCGKIPNNVKFLKEDQDLKVRGYQLASHGHKNGGFYGYSSINQKEQSLGKSISGHCHSAQKLRQTFSVGTCLPTNMFYMRGQPSAWTHSHALLWETGTVQLIHIFNGKWKIGNGR